MKKEKVDLVVVGAGIAGYTSAIDAKVLGIKVLLVEEEQLGGTFVHKTNVPQKAIYASTNNFNEALRSDEFAVDVAGVTFDYANINNRKDAKVQDVFEELTRLIQDLEIPVAYGRARFITTNLLEILDEEKRVIEFDKAIIATGAFPNNFPGVKTDGKRIQDFETINRLTKLPENMVIMAGNYHQAAYASQFDLLGVDVTMVLKESGVLEGFNELVSDTMTESFEKRGIVLKKNVFVVAIENMRHEVRVRLSDGEVLHTDMILIDTGIVPRSKNIGLKEICVKTDRDGFVKINEKLETSVPNIYAVGSVTGQALFPNYAAQMGTIAVKNVLGDTSIYDPTRLPIYAFTFPEAGAVGEIRFDECDKTYCHIKSYTIPLADIPNTKVSSTEAGIAEMIVDRKTRRILGVTVTGAQVTEFIAPMTITIEQKLTIDDIVESNFLTLTTSEVWQFLADIAFLDIQGE